QVFGSSFGAASSSAWDDVGGWRPASTKRIVSVDQGGALTRISAKWFCVLAAFLLAAPLLSARAVGEGGDRDKTVSSSPLRDFSSSFGFDSAPRVSGSSLRTPSSAPRPTTVAARTSPAAPARAATPAPRPTVTPAPPPPPPPLPAVQPPVAPAAL